MVQYLLSNENIDVNILYKYVKHKFNYSLSGHKIEKIALHLAVEKENFEIIQLLMNNPKININLKNKILLILNEIFLVFYDYPHIINEKHLLN